MSRRDAASNGLCMAVDGWPGNGRTPEEVVAAMRATGADARLLSEHAARWLDRPAVVGLFLAAGASAALIEEFTPKRQRSGFSLGAMAEGLNAPKG